jgi:hypothetical protein
MGMRLKSEPAAEAPLLQMAHRLFVEGAGDAAAVQELVQGLDLQVEAMGGADGLRGAARALHAAHPTYCFVIDRDWRSAGDAEQTWRDFPDPAQANLLIWRRHELESYFIDPTYLGQCAEFLRVTADDLARVVLSKAQERLYLYAANAVTASVSARLGRTWVHLDRDHADYPDAATARARLLARREFAARPGEVAAALAPQTIGALFDGTLDHWTGGSAALALGQGAWLLEMPAKEIWHAVVQECCRVEAADGRVLQGAEARRQVARSLLRLPLDQQPADFQELHRLLARHLQGAPTHG